MINLKSRNILIYGIGITNQAVMDYLDKIGINYDLYIDSMKKEVELEKYNLIIKTPGIKPASKIIEKAKSLNIQIITDLELYYLLNESSPIIGVTGSNGKTTVVTLIDKILNSTYHFVKGGNIGIPLFSLIDKPKDGSIIECSSFELDGTKSFKPHVWVILNIEKHHLDYHQSFENYFNTKTKCLDQMKSDDIVIYNYDDLNLREFIKRYNIRKFSFSLGNKAADIYIHENKIFYHNQEYLNLSCCKTKNKTINLDFMPTIIVGELYQISKSVINDVLINFQTLEHRCEIVKETKDIVIINDSKATSPTATLQAFEYIKTQFKEFEPLWIAGGKLTMDDYKVINNVDIKNVKTYLFGENKQNLSKILNKDIFDIQLFPSLEEIIKAIYKENLRKKIILFSPSSPSFDQYKSFEERGKAFKELINLYDKT